MPLLKRKHFALAETPKDLSPDEEIWQIRFTHEIFRDYSGYLERLNLFRQKIWSCRITGKSNLTYEEALVSEREANERLRQFPEELKAFVLQIVQFSMLKTNDLVMIIMEKLRETYLQGEELLGHFEGFSGPCMVMKIIGCKGSTSYEIGWLNENKEVIRTSIVDKKNLIRKKFPFTRGLLKLFIKESTVQNNPWVIHNSFTKKYGLPVKPPRELEDKITQHLKAGVSTTRKIMDNMQTDQAPAQTSKTSQSRKQPTIEEIVYPIEDLLVKPSRDDPVFTERPVPSINFLIPVADVGNFLMVWDFLSCFGKTLHLSPFSLNDFEEAIAYDGVPNLIVETHIALLTLLLKEYDEYYCLIQQKKRKEAININAWVQYLCDFLELRSGAKLPNYMVKLKNGNYSVLYVQDKLEILGELIHWGISTEAIKREVDKCIEKQQNLVANKREEDLEELRKRREEKRLKKEISGNITSDSNNKDVETDSNADVNMKVSASTDTKNSGNRGSKHEVLASRRALMMKNLAVEKEKEVQRMKELQKVREEAKAKGKEARERKLKQKRSKLFKLEMEKLHIWTDSLGKDRNHNRYWFFQRDGRIFVESADHSQWGFYSSKEELDVLMSSLNPKGERELALKQHLGKHYTRICSAFHKRSKEIVRKVKLEDTAVLRRSVRVSANPRISSDTPSFLQYINKR